MHPLIFVPTRRRGGGGNPITYIGFELHQNDPVVGYNFYAPSGCQDGDLIVFWVGSYNATPSAPAGTTQVGSNYTWTGYGYKSGLFYATYNSSTNPGPWVFSGGAYPFGWSAAYRYASAIGVTGSFQQIGGTTITLNGISTSANSVLGAAYTDGDASYTYTTPPGMTQRINANDPSVNGAFWKHLYADLLNADSSNRVFTASASVTDGVGLLFEILPL